MVRTKKPGVVTQNLEWGARKVAVFRTYGTLDGKGVDHGPNMYSLPTHGTRPRDPAPGRHTVRLRRRCRAHEKAHLA